jgi:hypothetical protein
VPPSVDWSGSCFYVFVRSHANEAAVAPAVREFHVAGDQGIQRIVFAFTNVFARAVFGAALPNQNRAGIDELSAKALYAESLSV